VVEHLPSICEALGSIPIQGGRKEGREGDRQATTFFKTTCSNALFIARSQNKRKKPFRKLLSKNVFLKIIEISFRNTLTR
jgi:hypothetical protein